MQHGPLTAEQAAQLIVARIYNHFHHHFHVRYVIAIVNDPYAQCYNWFLEWQRPHHRSRSVPLHSLPHADNNLAAVVRLVSRQVGMTVDYRGFAGQPIR